MIKDVLLTVPLVLASLTSSQRPLRNLEYREVKTLLKAADLENRDIGYLKRAAIDQRANSHARSRNSIRQQLTSAANTESGDRFFISLAAAVTRNLVKQTSRGGWQAALRRLEKLAKTTPRAATRQPFHPLAAYRPSQRLWITTTGVTLTRDPSKGIQTYPHQVESETTVRRLLGKKVSSSAWRRLALRIWDRQGRAITDLRRWRESVVEHFRTLLHAALDRSESEQIRWRPRKLAALIHELSTLQSDRDLEAEARSHLLRELEVKWHEMAIRLRICRAASAERKAVVAELRELRDQKRRSRIMGRNATPQRANQPTIALQLRPNGKLADGRRWKLTDADLSPASRQGGRRRSRSRERGRGRSAEPDAGPAPLSTDDRKRIAVAVEGVRRLGLVIANAEHKAASYLLGKSRAKSWGPWKPRVETMDSRAVARQLRILTVPARKRFDRGEVEDAEAAEPHLTYLESAHRRALGLTFAEPIPMEKLQRARIAVGDSWIQLATIRGSRRGPIRPLDLNHPLLRGASKDTIRMLQSVPETMLGTHTQYAIPLEIARAQQFEKPFAHGRSVPTPYVRKTSFAGIVPLKAAVPAAVVWQVRDGWRGLIVESCGQGFAEDDMSALLLQFVQPRNAGATVTEPPTSGRGGRGRRR